MRSSKAATSLHPPCLRCTQLPKIVSEEALNRPLDDAMKAKIQASAAAVVARLNQARAGDGHLPASLCRLQGVKCLLPACAPAAGCFATGSWSSMHFSPTPHRS